MAVDSWRSDAHDPAHDEPLPVEPVLTYNGVRIYPAWNSRRNAWQVQEAQYGDLGLDDWA